MLAGAMGVRHTKLLVFSDTHGHGQPMLDVVAGQGAGADACFFLGDGVRDTEMLREVYPQLPLYTVRGNCDMASFEPDDGLAPFGGLLIYYTHGHLLQVKDGLEALWWRARRNKADIVLYGHTHIPVYGEREGVHFFNPGSIALPRFGPPSYGVITIEDGKPGFEIVRLAGEER